MADTKYTYSIADDTANGAVATSSLTEEITDSAISSALLLYINSSGDVLDIWFDDPLSSGDQTTLDGVVADHEALPVPQKIVGGMTIEPIETPSGVDVTPQGTPGSTTYGYRVTAHSNVGETLASTEVQTTTGAATLGSTDFNRITWDEVDGAIEYSVYRTTAAGTPSSTGLIRSTPNLQVDDKGLSASGVVPSEDRSGALVIGESGGMAPSSKVLNLLEVTTDDSTVTSLISMLRRSSGTVVAGFGTGVFVMLNDDGDNQREAGAMHVLWTDPDTAALETAFRVMLRDGGTGIVERFRVTHDGKIELSGDEVLGVGACVDMQPVDGGIRGGTTTGSTNNDVAAIRFDNLGDGWNRINIKPPTRYTTGDLTFRLYCSVPSTVAASKGTRWKLEWSNFDIGEVFGSWDYNDEFTYDISSQASDQVFAIDFTIAASEFDKDADLMALKMTRLGTNAADDCNVHIYVHGLELRYTGYQVAGQ